MQNESVFRKIEGTNICVSKDGNLIFNDKTGQIYKQYLPCSHCAYKMIGTRAFGSTAAYVHILVIRAWAPETLKDGYEVHHINGDPSDNSFENLIALSKDAHVNVHRLIREKKSIDKELIKIFKEYKNKAA